MKRVFPFFIVLLSFFSCKEKDEYPKYDKNGTLIVYNEEEYTKLWIKNRKLKVITVDTFCINKTEQAKKDIKKGKLIYFGFNNPPIFKKLTLMLSKHGIETREMLRSCIRMGGFEPYCYQDLMNEEIYKKYGTKFIDSLTEIAKREYIIENPDKEYFENGIDLREKYLKK